MILYQPVIPQNTGSIARLCACTGAKLHLIEPLGFRTDQASVKRAGLDYWEHVKVQIHKDWDSFFEHEAPEQLYFFSKLATQSYFRAKYKSPLHLVFGSETKGLPEHLHNHYRDWFYKIPMRTHLVRSLNLAQCAAIVLYEAIRQNSVT